MFTEADRIAPLATITDVTMAAVQPLGLPTISDDQVRQLVKEIEVDGFGVIKSYLPADALVRVQVFVERSVAEAGGEYVGFTGKQSVAGTALDELSDPGPFETLLKRIYEAGTAKTAPKQSLYQVLRCLKGQSGLRHSMIFHYDSYVVTALVPILIPSSGQAGHLVMVPNFRRIRSSYLQSALDKVFLDNRFTQKLLRWAYEKGWLGMKQVAMVPGDLYFFWGYRTIHANEACDPAHIRATALYHFGDPHTDSAIRGFTGKAKVRANVTK